jgi:pimeloyl-ACP methyl ester carboxylesterase
MQVRSFRHSAGGINWYCELRGKGHLVVLVPSGEGDCSNFGKTADLLAEQFTVLTFDTPGFSRTSPPTLPEDISIAKLAGQIAELIRSLNLGSATFYGCSSGGRAVLDLALAYPELVQNALVHEAALPSVQIEEMLLPLAKLDDASVTSACRHLFAKVMNEDESLWEALGPEYHNRLSKNYVTWVRRYIAQGVGDPIDPVALSGAPLTWTIGSLSEKTMLQSNINLAESAGIQMGTLPCRHFPQVSIPDRLASHIAAATQARLSPT